MNCAKLGHAFGVGLLVLTWTSLPGHPLAEEILYQGRTLADWQKDLTDPVPGVRAQAVEALGQFGAATMPVLTGALEDPDVKVRVTVVLTLRLMGTPAAPALIQALGDAHHSVREQAVYILDAMGPEAIPALVQSLKDQPPPAKNPPAEVRRSVIEILGGMGPRAAGAVPVLIDVLREADLWPHAAGALGVIGPSAVSGLVNELTNTNLERRVLALYALRKMGPAAKDSVPYLVQMMVNDPAPIGQGNAAWTLRAIGPAAVQPLIQVLDNDDARQRGLAARALGEIGAAAGEATAALRKVEMSDPSSAVRTEAGQALRRIDGR